MSEENRGVGMLVLWKQWLVRVLSGWVVVAFFMGADCGEAATLAGLTLHENDQHHAELTLVMDEKNAPYQLFHLDHPSRLILRFPHSQFAHDAMQTLKGSGVVEHVTPIQQAEDARLEVTLKLGVQYKVNEMGKELHIHFFTPSAPVAVEKKHVFGAVLQRLEVRERGAATEVHLYGEHMSSNYNALTTQSGKTVMLNFQKGESHLLKQHYSYASPNLTGLTVAAGGGQLRLALTLLSSLPYQVHASEHEMVVRLGVGKKPLDEKRLRVEKVAFHADGELAKIVLHINLNDPAIHIQKSAHRVIMDIAHATLAAGQERTLDVRAFSGAVRQVDSYQMRDKVRIVARLRSKVEVRSFQHGHTLTLTLLPEQQNGAVKGAQIYHGEKVTFNYKDIDIRNALKLIAEMSDLNIIMSDDVQGTLTMHLVDVPWDQAFDLILQAKGLGKDQIGHVVRIAPLAVLQADADARKGMKKSAEDVAEMETVFIHLGYASVNDVEAILRGGSLKASSSTTPAAVTADQASNGGSSSGGASSELKLLSERGQLLLDERSNTLIITDTYERINNIKRLISVIDKPMQQVLIEARIVEANDRFSRDFGVRWGGAAQATRGLITQGVTGVAQGTNVVDLGAAAGAGAGGAIGYTLSKLNAFNLNLELSAAELSGDVKVVSSPRIFTSNLQEALIEQDEQIPFNQVTTTGGTTTITPIFKSAKLSLRVLPQITSDNRIVMTLNVKKDTPVMNAAGSASAVNSKTVKTKLLVKNGETVVLGGIYSTTTSDQVVGVPGLKDIPLLGHLFKRKTKVKNRSELLIFITPTVVDMDLQGRE